jgi:hypothetical protein
MEEKMKQIRLGLIAIGMILCLVTSAAAEVNISIGLPRVSIGINLPLFPDLVPVPGYPVYYAPRLEANYFFYDGMYWVYQDDNWYASSWYNGPWWFVEPEYVPVFVLRVPVRYYRRHPVYFRRWRANEPPRWGEHWGREWEERHRGWDRWERRSAPAPAPLPVYQREYAGDRYPRGEELRNLHREKYRYEPRDTIVRQHSQKQLEIIATEPAQREMRKESESRGPRQQDSRQKAPARPGAQTPSREGEKVQRPTPAPTPKKQQDPAKAQRQQPVKEQQDRQAPETQERGRKSQAKEEPQKAKRDTGKDQRQQPVTEQQDRQAPETQERGRKSQTKEESQKAKRAREKEQKKDEEDDRDRKRDQDRDQGRDR